MATFSRDLPAMFGDHHVTEVRSLLMALPGVEDVYASSSFRIVEVQYDESVLKSDEIETKLEEAGYTDDLPVKVERGALDEADSFSATNGDKPFFRQTAAYEQTGQSISFAQQVPFAGRPLWPCPGMGPIEVMKED